MESIRVSKYAQEQVGVFLEEPRVSIFDVPNKSEGTWSGCASCFPGSGPGLSWQIRGILTVGLAVKRRLPIVPGGSLQMNMGLCVAERTLFNSLLDFTSILEQCCCFPGLYMYTPVRVGVLQGGVPYCPYPVSGWFKRATKGQAF